MRGAGLLSLPSGPAGPKPASAKGLPLPEAGLNELRAAAACLPQEAITAPACIS